MDNMLWLPVCQYWIMTSVRGNHYNEIGLLVVLGTTKRYKSGRYSHLSRQVCRWTHTNKLLSCQVNTESLCLSSLFTDYDKHNAGDITEAGMERALGGACLLPPEPIFRAIVKKFREHSRRSSGGEINYRAFLAAVRKQKHLHWSRKQEYHQTTFNKYNVAGSTTSLSYSGWS